VARRTWPASPPKEWLRREPEQIDAERRHCSTPGHSMIDSRETGTVEAAARQLAERCRAKVVKRRHSPSRPWSLLGPCMLDELKAMPWAAARAAMAPVAAAAAAEAALNECRRRFQQPLDERDDSARCSRSRQAGVNGSPRVPTRTALSPGRVAAVVGPWDVDAAPARGTLRCRSEPEDHITSITGGWGREVRSAWLRRNNCRRLLRRLRTGARRTTGPARLAVVRSRCSDPPSAVTTPSGTTRLGLVLRVGAPAEPAAQHDG
jgi:hypothetical protein